MCVTLATIKGIGWLVAQIFLPAEAHLAVPSHVYIIAAQTNPTGIELGPPSLYNDSFSSNHWAHDLVSILNLLQPLYKSIGIPT